jgi:hypothetical protein
MTVPARHARAKSSVHRESEFEDDCEDEFDSREFYSGERVCPPPASLGGGGGLKAAIFILIVLGGGWALLGNPATWPTTWQGWRSAVVAAVSGSMDLKAPGSAESAVAAVNPPVPPALTELATKPVPDPPAANPQPPVSSQTAAPSAPAKPEASPTTTVAIAVEEAPPASLPPPVVELTDPYQKRAAAVGLHPNLSRVLLARLSPIDYRNAGIAIQRAVAGTPDTGVFVWPQQRKPELALFQVRFVPGAAPHCRRYVVTVTKDRWSTTALPMEKCGSKLAGH